MLAFKLIERGTEPSCIEFPVVALVCFVYHLRGTIKHGEMLHRADRSKSIPDAGNEIFVPILIVHKLQEAPIQDLSYEVVHA